MIVTTGNRNALMSWQFVLFLLAFNMALAASVAMIVHAKDVQGSGHENVLVPACMMAVNALKMPKLWLKYKARPESVNQLLVLGTGISFCLWSASLALAV